MNFINAKSWRKSNVPLKIKLFVLKIKVMFKCISRSSLWYHVKQALNIRHPKVLRSTLSCAFQRVAMLYYFIPKGTKYYKRIIAKKKTEPALLCLATCHQNDWQIKTIASVRFPGNKTQQMLQAAHSIPRTYPLTVEVIMLFK